MRRDVFQAIADPNRRAILALLATTAMTPNALANHFSSSRQMVSKNLKILTECEVVRTEHKGREVYYHLELEKMKEIDAWIAHYRVLWEKRLDQLDNLLDRLKNNPQ